MAEATALGIAGQNLVFGSGVCAVLPSRSYSLTCFGGIRFAPHYALRNSVSFRPSRRRQVQALLLEPSDGAQENLDEFVKRMEQTWSITKQPRPVQCKSCSASGQVECPWCKGTGFFFLGDHMLCEVPSRNTTCRVCFGRCTLPCDDCKGTGFRAKWLGEPQKPKRKDG
ncbi:unnamed protein product [Calypogeia fissa]